MDGFSEATGPIPEPGSVSEFVIEGIGFSGEGYFCPAPGRFVSVPHALAGDRVRVKIGDWRRGRAWGEIVEFVERSSEHVDPGCSAYERCSGCALRHMSPDRERAWKAAALREILVRYAGHALSSGGETTPFIPFDWVGEPHRGGHRSRGRFRVQVSGAEVRVGLTSVGLDRDVVDVRRCPAQTPRFVEVLEHVGRTLDGCPATAAGLETVAVSVGATGEALVEAAGTPSARALVAAAVHELARARTVEGPDDPGLTLDNGVVAPVGSWVPANPAAANLMVEWVIETLGRQRHHAFVLDLCCGPGTVTAKLAERYRVVAVDRDHRATRALVDANLPNVTVRAGAVGRILRKLRRELRGPGPTAAVVNPMRLPLGDQLDDLRALGIEQVVYLGPSPVSACRDANRLAQLSGYRLRRYAAVDLHPGTSQVMLALDLALDTAQPRGIR